MGAVDAGDARLQTVRALARLRNSPWPLDLVRPFFQDPNTQQESEGSPGTPTPLLLEVRLEAKSGGVRSLAFTGVECRLRDVPKTAKTQGRKKNAGSDLITTLKERFESHPHRHPGLAWERVEARLNAGVLAKLAAMEESGGEPDVALIEGPDVIVFVDCAVETPEGRRSLCYDREAWQARKEARPAHNALDMAASMGIEILTEGEYRQLQKLEAFDTKTSSWIKTPPAIRELGGALFCDRRYDQVFVYHNGAQSYYAARGFRAKLRM